MLNNIKFKEGNNPLSLNLLGYMNNIRPMYLGVLSIRGYNRNYLISNWIHERQKAERTVVVVDHFDIIDEIPPATFSTFKD